MPQHLAVHAVDLFRAMTDDKLQVQTTQMLGEGTAEYQNFNPGCKFIFISGPVR
jgi:hypothetical protein